MTTEISHASGVRLLRMGTFYWGMPNSQEASIDGLAMILNLANRLRADPRVIEVRAPHPRDIEYELQKFYPPPSGELDSILFGSDVRTTLVIEGTPVAFQVQVPIKNQPKREGVADVPSDTYTAVWNGVTLVIMWSQETQDIPFSGGHIVNEILRDAVENESGASLVNQPCSPGCGFQFMHPTMVLQPLSKEDIDNETDLRLTRMQRPGPSHFYLSTEMREDNYEVLLGLAFTLMYTANNFADAKNLGQRIIAIERAAREELQHAIAHQYRSSQIALLPAHNRPVAHWKNRFLRRHLRQLLVTLALCLANLETLIRQWEQEIRHFDEIASEGDQRQFFGTDMRSDEAQIRSLELDHLQSAVEQIANSINTSAMVTATIGGALAGGLTGGMLGAIASIIGH